MTEFGYAGEILSIDLSSRNSTRLPTSGYADRFIGGRGIAAKLYWDMTGPDTGAFTPDNCLVCATGPVAGFPGFSGGRWQVCGKTAALEGESFSYANMGGRWGIRLKRAGYDAMVVQGKAERPSYLYIHDDKIEIRDASNLWGTTAFETCKRLKLELGKGVSVLTIGQAAENLVVFATMLTDDGASGSGGLGSVMGSKNLKAIVVAGDNKLTAADPEKLREITGGFSRPKAKDLVGYLWTIPGLTKPDKCYGCGIGCARQSYMGDDGYRYKAFCQPMDMYQNLTGEDHAGSYEVRFSAIRLCDQYGLDTIVMQPVIDWLFRCREEGILNDNSTGIPLSEIGSIKFMEELTRKISFREGFGDLLAEGILKTAEATGKRAKELVSYSIISRANEKRDYDPRLMLHNAILLATAPRRPISQLHEASVTVVRWLVWLARNTGGELPPITGVSPGEIMIFSERFWGSAVAADFSTYEGKALASKKIQDRTITKESLVICDLMWPLKQLPLPGDDLPDPGLPCEILKAVTGRDLDVEGLDEIGERIYNVQRAIMIRQGWEGREGDQLLEFFHSEPLKKGTLFFDPECLVPGPNGNAVSREGAVVEKQKFEKMKDEYYTLRGWDVESGFQTEAGLRGLQIGDIADGLKEHGLLK